MVCDVLEAADSTNSAVRGYLIKCNNTLVDCYIGVHDCSIRVV